MYAARRDLLRPAERDSQYFHWEHEPAGPVAVDRHQRVANRLDGDIALGP
jgi:hypothetical protein